MYDNRRQNNRVNANLPVEICIGSQVTIQGFLRDLSLKSAFISMKGNIYLQVNDELNFLIKCAADDLEKCVGGVARISRIAAGEGIAIYFTKLDENASAKLQQLIK
jgi:hypothetical protein